MRDLPEPERQAADVVLHRIAYEVQHCEVILRGIETAVAAMIANRRAESGSHALQDIDLLGQSLADIATCVTGLADQVGSTLSVDARRMLAPLRLDDLYQRLSGKVPMELLPEERIALF